MKNKDLIALLSQYNPNADVVVWIGCLGVTFKPEHFEDSMDADDQPVVNITPDVDERDFF